jgi:DNA-binding beta-propeller fold protein YncE
MIIADRWDGTGVPFQGDRTLRLLAIPAGARIVSARARVRPASADAAAPFVERLSLEPGAAPGTSAAAVAQGSAVEVDLRGRRLLHAVEGAQLDGARLAVDPGGGIFVPVALNGTLGGPPGDAFSLSVEGGVASLPGVAATRMRLWHDQGDPPRVTGVRVRGAPAGLTLRVGGQPAFWAHPAELTDEAVTPDFAPLLAAWLAEQGTAGNGYTAVPIVLHTETLSRLEVVVEVQVLLEATLLPGGIPEATLPFDLSSLAVPPRGAGASGDFVARLPAGAAVVPGQTRIRVRGAFAETRAVPGRGPTGVIDPEAAKGRALVSPTFSQAQEVPPGAGAVIVGVDLLLRPVTRAAVLQVDLRGDAGGRPDRESLLPQTARVAIREGAEPGGAVWAGARFEAPLTVDPCRRYWLVLQAVEGEAEWVAYRAGTEAARRLELAGGRACPPAPPADAPPLQHSDDGGASWRSGGALLALYRLRSLPARYEVPLQVEVGDGLHATRVGLDRFAPLARVDFTVDDAALADAVTRHARGGPDGCAPGEALADGGFEAWTVEGEGMDVPVALAGVGPAPRRVAVSPDGRWAYVLAGGGGAPLLLRVDVPADAVVAQVALDPALPLSLSRQDSCALVVHPDGSRAFVVAASRAAPPSLLVQPVDLEQGRAAGPARILPPDPDFVLLPGPGASPPPVHAAISPDGGTLWVAGGEGLAALDVDALGDAGGAVRVISVHPFPDERVACIAVSPDGARLCVGTAAAGKAKPGAGAGTTVGPVFDRGRLHLLDVAGGGAVQVELPALPRDVAVTPDGRRAVVALATGAALVELDRLAVIATRAGQAVAPGSVVVDPDGVRAYLGVAGAVAVLELDRNVLLPGTSLGVAGTPAVLAVTPQGDRLYAVTGAGARAFPLGTRRLSVWTAESGRMEVGPPTAGGPRSVILRGGGADGPAPAVLLQSVAVSPACRYVFSFGALASRGSGASAELLWVGARGEPIDAWPVPMAEGESPAADAAPPLRPHRRVVVPPAGSARVEVRFRVPVGVARIAAASLAVSPDLLVNGDLRLPLLGEDGGWTVEPEARAAVVRALAPGGTRVTGVGPGTAEVVQQVDVRPGVPLRLRMEGRGLAAPDGAVPWLRVSWLDAGGRETGTAAALAVHPDDFSAHVLRLDPPAGAVRARVALLVPPRAAVQAERLTLVPAPEVDVPVRFIASAPGELTVTDARVVYDLGAAGGVAAGVDTAGSAAPAAGPPSSAPAPGTPPAAGGGSGGDDDGCCGDDGEAPTAPATGQPSRAAQPRTRTVPIAAPRATSSTRWELPRDTRAPAAVIPLPDAPPLTAPVVPPPPAEDATPPPNAGELTPPSTEEVVITRPPDDRESIPVPLIPVREVPGVGEVREGRFVREGIVTAQDLAASSPELVVHADPTLSIKQAQSLIAAAAELVSLSNT